MDDAVLATGEPVVNAVRRDDGRLRKDSSQLGADFNCDQAHA
ncbi:hypothetical protein [Micromonospora endolithica]|nr:hypothetical protein [Micromonospora endolithica]